MSTSARFGSMVRACGAYPGKVYERGLEPSALPAILKPPSSDFHKLQDSDQPGPLTSPILAIYSGGCFEVLAAPRRSCDPQHQERIVPDSSVGFLFSAGGAVPADTEYPVYLDHITDTTNTGEHQELRRLRQSDPELYELKLFEWDYVSQIDDLQETTPDLDDPNAPEVFFTVSGQQDEPATRTSSFVGARTTHLG